ncbi:hypothetical protein [Methylocapsa sp. S129]|uniref:hypothetical protein n=1 Tax=Methylocapsa sp. S129 TaxID=1641869 RepID=UPI00131E543D|nr:hypothetical protein [Methylocapsa sp. S129]
MFHHSVRLASRATLAGASLLTLVLALGAFPRLAAAWPVGQEEEVTLDDFTTTSKDGDVMTIKHAEFKGTNLSEDEIKKLLTPDTSQEDKTALMQKLKVGEMSIPLIDVAPKKGGAIHIHDVTGSDIDSGKVGKFGFSGIDGSGTDKDGPVSIKAGAFTMENADLADALGAAKDPKQISPLTHLGHVSWEGLDFTVPDKDAGPGKTIHIALGSVEIRNNYDGDILKDGATTVKGLVIEPSKGSEFANSLAILGYTRVELSAHVAAHYDAGAKKLTLDDFTIDSPNAGAIKLKADFADIDPALFGADASARMGAVMGGAIAAIEIKFVNAGLFEKSVTYFADQQKTTPDALKKQWMGAAGQMLPAVLGGDPSALKVAAEAQKFIAAPTNLTISLHPKSGTFKFTDAVGAGDPMALISTIDIAAAANK